ncbi:MAG: hypothetical protein ACJ8AO_08560 [Gemmatimonadaceae bacterium]
MSARRLLGVAAVAVACAAHDAAAQGAAPLDRLAPATRATVTRLVDSARAAGLPWEAVGAKAAEGALKGADDARIVAALRTLVAELSAAREALGLGANASDVVAGASALHVGVPADELRRLARERDAGAQPRALATPLVVLADLVTRRVPPSAAAAAVGALVRKGAADADFAALRADVERDILAGEAPQKAAAARARVFLERP